MKPRPSRRSNPPGHTAVAVAVADPEPEPHAVPWPILIAAAILLIACFSPAFQDHDAWWHLRTGEYIVQNHRLPVPDPFAFTTYIGPPSYPGEDAVRYFNLTHEWLAQACMYLAYAAGGFPLVVLLRALLMAAACVLTGMIAFHRSKSYYVAVGAALLGAVLSYRFAYDRPLLVTFLFTAALMALLEYGRRLWVIPVLFLIWANCHGGFFMGWVVLAAWCADSFVRRVPDLRLYAFSAAGVVVSGVNPNGFRVFTTLLAYRESYMQSLLAEWRHTPLWPPSPFVMVTAIAAFFLIRAGRRARLVDWLLFGAFAIAGLYAFRNVVYMALIGPVVIAACLPWKPGRLAPKWEWVAAAVILGAIALPASQDRSFRLSGYEATRPAGAVRFLQAHHVSGTLFNTYEQGGYLMWRLWPQMKVFVDGRALNEAVFKDYRRITYSITAPGQKTPFQLLDQYGVDTILITGYEYFTGSPHFLIAILADPKQTDWKLVFQDSQAMIFMRHPPPGVQPLPNIAALASMQAQCAAHIALVPAEPLCARETCKLYEHLGDLNQARAWMAYYLEHKKEPDPEAETEFQRLNSMRPR